MESKPLVSIHVISYNQAPFIAEALQSAVDQDYENLEVVVADDGSTDGTADIIRDFARRHPGRIVALVGGPNLGITGNSNRALKVCHGKYVAFLGGDDVFVPGKITKQVQWLEENPERVLCGHQAEVFYQDGRPSHMHTRVLRRGKGPREFIRHGPLFGALCMMIRAERAPTAGFDPSLQIVSDGLFFAESLMGGGEYGYVSGVLARHRRHSSNVTLQWERGLQDLTRMFRIIRERYPQYRSDADIGEANLVLYGYGLKHLQEGRAGKAMSYFGQSIARNPCNPKTWVRLVQSLLKKCVIRDSGNRDRVNG